MIKSEEFTEKQNTTALQELQNKIQNLTDIEHPLSATEFINVDLSISMFEDSTIEEIIANQN